MCFFVFLVRRETNKPEMVLFATDTYVPCRTYTVVRSFKERNEGTYHSYVPIVRYPFYVCIKRGPSTVRGPRIVRGPRYQK